MLKRNIKFTSLLLGLFLSVTVTSIKPINVSAASNRLWGQDRYETSVAISKAGWTNSDYVILASGEGYADALCAAPLAKKYNAPILLTESNALNQNTKEEIKRLGAKHIFIIGKYASVSQSAENELASIASDVQRLGGNDRYETSVIVAKQLGTVDKVAVTSGYGFADALSIAPIAAQENMPILLTGKDELPQVVRDYIQDYNASIKNSYVIGGQGVISDTAATQLSSSAVRLSGSDRFETNLKVMQYFKDELKFDNLYVVQADGPTGNEFADALSGTALAVKTSSPVLLTYKTVSSDIENFIKANVKANTTITPLGGVAAVPDELVSGLQAIVPTIGSTINQIVGGGSAGGGSIGGIGNASSSGSSSSNDQLASIVSKLNSIAPTLQSDNEKTIATKIITSINNVIANPNYDCKSDANEAKGLYNNLSASEKSDFKTKVLDNMNIGQLLQLAAKFGL